MSASGTVAAATPASTIAAAVTSPKRVPPACVSWRSTSPPTTTADSATAYVAAARRVPGDVTRRWKSAVPPATRMPAR